MYHRLLLSLLCLLPASLAGCAALDTNMRPVWAWDYYADQAAKLRSNKLQRLSSGDTDHSTYEAALERLSTPEGYIATSVGASLAAGTVQNLASD